MKKYRFYLVLLLSVFMFLLAGCDKKSDNDNTGSNTGGTSQAQYNYNIGKITDKKSFTLVEGDEYAPFHSIDSSFTFGSEDEKVCKVDSKGVVKCVGAGKTKINVYKDQKLYGFIDFNVDKADVINYNFNQAIYDELVQKTTFDSNSIMFDQTISTNGVNRVVAMKLRKEPFYYEMKTNDGSTTSTQYCKYSKVNNNLFLYIVNDAERKIEKTYIKDFKLSDYTDVNMDFLGDLEEMDNSKLELNKISDNEFVIKNKLGDSLDMVKEFLGSDMDEYINLLGNNVMTTKVVIGEDSLNIDISMSLHFVYEKLLVFNIPINVNYTLTYKEFADFNTTGYTLSEPKCFEEVEEEEELDEFELEGYKTKYSYTYLEKGSYVAEFIDDPFFNDCLKITLCDKNLDEINDREFSSAEYLNNVFNVKEDGYYYISFKNGISSDYNCKFTKLDDVDNKELEFKTSTGSIEGKYDYKKFTYSSTDENEVLKLTNLTDNKLYLYSATVTTSNFQNYITLDENGVAYLNPQENSVIYVVSAIESKNCSNSFDYKYNYSFKVESIINNNGSDYNNLNELTTEYSTEEYMIGYKYPVRKVLLKAEKAGRYGLYSFGLNGKEEHMSLSIDGDTRYPSNGWEVDLPAGEYVVKITANDHVFDICKVKYYFLDTADKDVNITVPNGEGNVKNEQVMETQKIRYFFTLEEDSYLLFNPEQVTIFDLSDKALTIKAKNTYDMRKYYFKLKAGSYYLIYRGTWYLDEFTFGKATTTPTEFVDINNVQELISGEKYDVAAGYNNCGFGKVISMTTTLKITHNRARVTVFDENMNELTIDYVDVSTYTINLQQGKTYYIFFVSRDVSEPTYIICRYEAFNKSVNITIPVSDNSYYVKNEQTIDGQVIKYNFTLEEDSYLCFNPGEVVIYDLNDNRVSFMSSDSIWIRNYSFKVKAGSYYAIFSGTYFIDGKRYVEEFVLCTIKSSSNPIDIENAPILTSGETYNAVGQDKGEKFGYGKFVAKEAEIKIINSNAYVEVYDENMNRITTTFINAENNSCTLEKEKTYYILFANRDRINDATIRYEYV